MKKLSLILLAASLSLLAACGTSSPPQAYETQSDAEAIALAHAGLTEADVTFIHTEPDREDGRTVFNVEFYTKDHKEYDYEIDSVTGEILSFDQDADGFAPSSSATTTVPDINNGTITEEDAKQIALAKVPGATANDIREFKMERDDGQLAYEGTIVYDKIEYEFQIDAQNGTIAEWESESIFD